MEIGASYTIKSLRNRLTQSVPIANILNAKGDWEFRLSREMVQYSR